MMHEITANHFGSKIGKTELAAQKTKLGSDHQNGTKSVFAMWATMSWVATKAYTVPNDV